jgi:membrane fusion protein, heavy metal efflux system
LPNPHGILRAGMFVTAMFRANHPVDRVVVPSSAVVHLHDKDWVFVPAGQNQFRRVSVQLGAQEKDGSQQVISGLKPGDRVVTNALQFSSAAEE